MHDAALKMQEDGPVKLLLVAGTFLVFLFGCAQNAVPTSPPAGRTVPPPVEGRSPIEHTLIDKALPQRPAWIDNEPGDKDGMHFLVGLSEHHASERDGREDAMRYATMEFAKFTGVEVSEVSQVVKSLYGSSSGVLDATVSGQEESSASVQARVSRIKAVQWYWEKYRSKTADIDLGVNYRCWVLVSVPQDEPQRVEAWLRDRREAVDAEWRIFRDGCRERLGEIDRLITAGELLPALGRIQGEWSRLAGRLDDFREKKEIDGAKIAEVEQVQRDLLGRLTTLRNAIRIDTGRFGAQCYLPDKGPAVIPVWAWVKTASGQIRPVEGLPLVLRGADGKILARAAVGVGGQADFHLPSAAYGTLAVSVDAEGAGGALAEPLLMHLAKAESSLSITKEEATIDGAIRGAINRLFGGSSMAPLPARRVVVGPVTYGESGLGSEFAPVLKRHLSEHLIRVPQLEVIVPRTREVTAVAWAAQTRGITAQGTPGLGSAATQARIDEADAALESTYLVSGDEVQLSLALKEAGTDRLLAAGSSIIDRRTIPVGLSLVPAVANPLPAAVTSGDLRLQMTSHLGDGQTYAEGESISYFINLDRDAYLLLIYEDAGGNLIRILPNRYAATGFYRAGSTIQVPAKTDRFEFTIAPPFGVERVWAFAASSPFPSLPGRELENGLALLALDLDTLLARVRAAGGGQQYGEAVTTVTTVPKRGGVAMINK